MKGLKSILFVIVAMMTASTLVISCDDWTEPEAKDYFSATANTEAYKAQLKNYFNSPHKVMFGWFGSWSAGNISNKLIGLPDSTDFVSLWLCYGNLNEAQQADLKAFQKRGSRAVLCWLNTNIGENITPGVNGVPNQANAFKYWGYIPTNGITAPRYDENLNAALDVNGDTIWVDYEYTIESHIAAAQKYAEAIADTCEKYNIDGFDADIESTGTLIQSGEKAVVLNEFFRTLIKRFETEGRWLVIDIPGGISVGRPMSLSTVVLTTSLMLLRDTNRRYSKKCFQNLSSQLRLNVLLTSTSSRFNQVGDIVTVFLTQDKVHTTLSMITRVTRTILTFVQLLLHRILRSMNNHF